MAGASTKKTATANEAALQRLQIGFVAVNGLYFVLRYLLRPRGYFSGASLMYILTLVPSLLIYRFLLAAGSPKRNNLGHVYKAGEDLGGKGPIEWATDTLYVIWIVSILAPLIGYKSYWLLLAIPAWVAYKGYEFAAPMIAKQAEQAKQKASAQQAPARAAVVETVEPLSRTAQKKADKQKRAEAAQRGVRR